MHNVLYCMGVHVYIFLIQIWILYIIPQLRNKKPYLPVVNLAQYQVLEDKPKRENFLPAQNVEHL